MHRRWDIHLPFKEASTVDFTLWSSKAAQMADAINSGDCRYCMDVVSEIPSCHCLADLYDLALSQTAVNDEAAAGEIEADAKKMLNRRSTLQEALRCHRGQCVETITQMVTAQLSNRHDLVLPSFSDLLISQTVCSSLLTELSELLQQMHDQLVKLISSQEYDRLAERILLEAEYEGPKARREARERVLNWRNGVPQKNLDSDRKEQIECVKDEIRKTKHGVKLEQYVDLDDDLPRQRSEFGRFLFHRRREITRDELRHLIQLIYTIYYYQQDARQAVGQPEQLQPDNGHQTPDFPDLPADFDQKLRDSKAATVRFYRILLRVEPFINSGKPEGSTEDELAHYKDWTWYHLKAAFEELGFMQRNSSKAPFAEYIHLVFQHRTKESVERSLHRNTNPNSPNIVADVVKEFETVKDLLK